MSNVYEKLQEVRVELQNMSLKKSGKHKHFNYYELQDFLPQAQELFKKNKLFPKVSFYPDMANLVIINMEATEEQIEFTSTIEEAKLVNGTKIQELGAMQTYLRRYLYMNALEIVEHDSVDKQEKAPEKKTVNEKLITSTEANKIFEAAESLGLEQDERNALVRKILDENGYKGQGTAKIKKTDYVDILAKIKEAGSK